MPGAVQWIRRWLRRLALALLACLVLLLSPIAYIETMCRGTPVASDYQPIISDAEWQRPESRTLMTYPEWHIVHAYADYAELIRTNDPHDFGYLQSIAGFWGSLCALSEASAAHGGFRGETKKMVYTIGASFSAELALKALYEETVGRIVALIRGPERSLLDRLSAEQAARYAIFLQQTPWYRWDFQADAIALGAAATPALRDRERALALGLEFRAKSAYAGVIAAAVAGVGADELQLRSIVAGVSPQDLAAIEGVKVIAERAEGIEIETPRYRAYTVVLQRLAARGGRMVEIAGNDDILLTALSDEPWARDGLFQFQRQGRDDFRHLLLVKVPDLLETIRSLPERGLRLEHVHDY